MTAPSPAGVEKKRNWGPLLAGIAVVSFTLGIIAQTIGIGGKMESLAAKATVNSNINRISILENEVAHQAEWRREMSLQYKELDAKIDLLLERTAGK